MKTHKKILPAIISSAFVASLAATPIVNTVANPFAAKHSLLAICWPRPIPSLLTRCLATRRWAKAK